MDGRYRMNPGAMPAGFNPQAPTFTPTTSSSQPGVAGGMSYQPVSSHGSADRQGFDRFQSEWPALPSSEPTQARNSMSQKEHTNTSLPNRLPDAINVVSPRPQKFSGIADSLEAHPMVRELYVPPHARGRFTPHHDVPLFTSQAGPSTFPQPTGGLQPARSLSSYPQHTGGLSSYPQPSIGLSSYLQPSSGLSSYSQPSSGLSSYQPAYRVHSNGMSTGPGTPPVHSMNPRMYTMGHFGPPAGTTPMQQMQAPTPTPHMLGSTPVQHMQVPGSWTSYDARQPPMASRAMSNASMVRPASKPYQEAFRAPQQVRPNGAMHSQHPGIQNMPYPQSLYSTTPFRSTPDATLNRQGALSRNRNKKSAFPRRRFQPKAKRTDQGPMPSEADIYPDDTSFTQDEQGYDSGHSEDEERNRPFNPEMAMASLNLMGEVPNLMESTLPSWLRTPYPVKPSTEDRHGDGVDDILLAKLPDSDSDSGSSVAGDAHSESTLSARAMVKASAGVGSSSARSELKKKAAPNKEALTQDQIDGSKYGLRLGGIGLNSAGSTWNPPVLDARFEKVKHLWDNNTK